MNGVRISKEHANFFRAQISVSRFIHDVGMKHVEHPSDWDIIDVFNR